MKLAISNIAWPASEDTQVAGLLRDMGVHGVEVAPTAVWPTPLGASEAQVSAYREFWERSGIRIVALQALLFGRPDLTIFEREDKRRETLAHLAGMIRLAARLGATVLVFGSPKNRKVGGRDSLEAGKIALSFFRDLGRVAVDSGVVFCIEPNPPEYGCDYLTTAGATRELVASIDSPGLGIHLDAGGMTLGREPLSAVEDSLPWLRHFHISEPHLEQIGAGDTEHGAFAQTLATHGYQGWASIEMRQPASEPLPLVAAALKYSIDRYAPLWPDRRTV